jgi:hypothetical protein
MRTFYREAQVADERWEGRFAERFALAYAAGRLAIGWDILPWRGRELLDAVVATYQVSRSVVPQETSTTDIVAKICAGLRDRSRIHDLRSTTQHTIGPNVNEADGFIKQDKQGVYYAVKRAAFERWVGKNVDLASLGKQLLQDGYLITEARRHDTPTMQVKIRGISGKPRYYCIRENLILSRGAGE